MEARRAPPAVPPKPRRPRPFPDDGPAPAPAVPRSCLVGAAREPSYSTGLASAPRPRSHRPQQQHPLYSNERLYGNVNADGAPPRAPPSPVSSSYSELRRAADRPEPSGYGSACESLYEPIEPRPRIPSQSPYARAGPQAPGPQAPRRTADAEAEADALAESMVRALEGVGSNGHGEPEAYGRCAECGRGVVGEASGCTAMDRVYHVGCFACHRCRINLQGKPFYALNGKPHCEEDYLDTLEKCCVCTDPILDRILRATGKPYHPECFACVVCGESLDGVPFTVDATNRVHCIEDFHRKFAPRCSVCLEPIMPEPGREETVRVVALDRSFHVSCYRCEDCGLPLSSEAEDGGCYPLDDHVLCKNCNAKRVRALTEHITTEL